MKNFFILAFSLFVFQNISIAKDTIQFNFPNDGWHKVTSPDGVQSKKCYVPYNQTAENYTEMLIFMERELKTQGLTPVVMMQRQLGKDRNNYNDIIPEYINQDINDAMVTWCSQLRNTCTIQRAFQGTNGVIFAIYINKAPHYSQNMFGQWSNILNSIKVYNSETGEKPDSGLIELD